MLDKRNEQIHQVLVLLGSPEMVNNSHEMAIRTFISEYPYVQPAYYLLAKAAKHEDHYKENLALAATYCPNGTILYRTVHQSISLPKIDFSESFSSFVKASKIVLTPSSYAIQEESVETIVETAPVDVQEPIIEEKLSDNKDVETIVETAPVEAQEPIIEEKLSDTKDVETIVETVPVEVQEPIIGEKLSDIKAAEKVSETASIDVLEPIIEEKLSDTKAVETVSETAPIDVLEPKIEETNSEVMVQEAAEIADADEQEKPVVEKPKVVPIYIETYDHGDDVFEYYSINPFENHVKQDDLLATTNIEEEVANEEILIDQVGFIAPQEKLNKLENSEAVMVHELQKPQIEEENQAQSSIPSKYDDDALPYSFLWWLQKTRKEYHQNHQPFAKKAQEKVSTNVAFPVNNLLEEQYKQHIFHLQTPFNMEDHLANDENTQAPKVNAIIERFIENEPQISAPNSEKLDNENKARSSASDVSEFVSETLAKIYVEQMLYHKAIATYKKLSLKYPEKNRYFADLIHQLENKIN